MTTDDGYARLRRWLESKGWTLQRLADVLGVGLSAVTAWGQGRTRPSLDTAAAIEAVTGGSVPATVWASQGAVSAARERAEKSTPAA
jgi:transcriptional regulator with XRE-family HTH domain